MGAFSSLFPTRAWELELGLALLSAVCLLVQASSYHMHHMRRVDNLLFASIAISALLFVDSYFTLISLEKQYENWPVGSTDALKLVDGIPLNQRRFREQRDVYLAFFTIVIDVAIYFVNRLQEKIDDLGSKLYRLQKKSDDASLAQRQ